MWGVSGPQLHGIFNHRLAEREVVKDLDLYLNWI